MTGNLLSAIARYAFSTAQGLAKPKPAKRAKDGGARRDRTDDLMLAKHALYQLSYGPNHEAALAVSLSPTCPPEDHTGVWWAQADSNCRPHAYQACALTN